MSPNNSTLATLSKSLDGQLFKLLVANIEDYGILMIDANGLVLSWNHGGENILGYSADEIIGKDMSAFYTAADNQNNIHRQNLNSALRNGKFETEDWRVHKNGALFWANVVITTLYNEKGLLIGFAKIIKDITERKKIEDQKTALNVELEKRVKENTDKIIASELRFRKIIENSYDGITLLDKNLKAIYRSPSAQRISGFTLDERNDVLLENLVHPNDWQIVADMLKNVFAKPGIPILSNYRTKHKNGTYMWLECLYTNMLDNTTIGAIVCNFRDITGQKHAEREIQILNETLEKKVIERTQQLEVANKELESFSYSVSHDLRTPLRAINGYAMMLKEDFEEILSGEGKRVLHTIIDNARLMGQLIDDLLTFSRLGRKEVKLQKIDMKAMVKTSWTQLAPLIGHQHHVIINNLLPCEADNNLINQVWLNLLSNAIKYSAKASHPVIEVGCIAERQHNVYFVKDNGVGFDMQYSNKLFGVFQRLHRNDEFEGTGVGLALVKRIIDKHNGKVWAEAAPGLGATFFFAIPLKTP